MELCPSALKGLKLLTNSTIINEDIFTKILSKTVCDLADTHSPLSDSCQHLQSDGAKEASGALMTLFLTCARFKVEPDTLTHTLLDTLKIPNQRSDAIVSVYRANKAKLEAALARVGTHLPHIVDASWTMDYCTQASHLSSNGQVLYNIQLHTESATKEEPYKNQETHQFTCNLQQLQDLVFAMKESYKLIDRGANN